MGKQKCIVVTGFTTKTYTAQKLLLYKCVMKKPAFTLGGFFHYGKDWCACDLLYCLTGASYWNTDSIRTTVFRQINFTTSP